MKHSVHTVLVVEDDGHTRRQLVASIDAHPLLRVVGEAPNFATGSALLRSTPCQVLLTDLGLPDGDGIDLIRQAADLGGIESMVITVFGDERHVLAAVEAGATGYLLKDASAADVADAVLMLVAGGSPISPRIARHVLKRFRAQPPPRNQATAKAPRELEVSSLTPRETEVLKLVSRGCSNQEIADLLTLSFHTVTSHIKQIYRKLAVRSRSEAVFEASSLGIISFHDPG